MGLKKSKVSKKIHDHEYIVTGVRKIKHGTEVDLDILKDEKGGACVKFFGPKKKHKYTVVINKMKKYPQINVKIIATKVIIPLLDTYISKIKREDTDGRQNGNLKSAV